MKLTKNRKVALEKIEKGKAYAIDEAAKLVKEVTTTKFDASVDMDIRLGVDPKKANQMVRGVVTLPHGTGKTVRVLVLCTPDKEKEAQEAGADYYGLDEYVEKGIDEPVIEKGSTLSSGQRQLISFARALAFDPAILILDEATSNIDSETEEIIQHAMDVLKRGRTTFIIAHRLSTIKNADKILVLDRGEIVEQGNHDELVALGGKYELM